MKKLSLLVLFGGISSEHKVSRISAFNVLQGLDLQKYNPYIIGITKQGKWLLFESTDYSPIRDGSWETSEFSTLAFLSPDRIVHGITVIRNNNIENIHIDCVFPVLHGIGGEDGTVQGLCELAGIPYVGPGIASSANSMDKSLTKILIEQTGIKQAGYYLIKRKDFFVDKMMVLYRVCNKLNKFPLFVKPCRGGSSIGVSKVNSIEELERGLISAFTYDDKVLVEEYINGREIIIAVLGNELPIASIAGEIVPKQEFYTYDAKYNDDATELHIPARISAEAMKTVRDCAIQVYEALDCNCFSRVDFFYCPESNDVVFNEINTLPGYIHTNTYPALFEGKFVFSDLVDMLINYAIQNALVAI